MPRQHPLDPGALTPTLLPGEPAPAGLDPEALAQRACALPRLLTIEPLPSSARNASIPNAVLTGLALVATARSPGLQSRLGLVDDSLLSAATIDALEQVSYALLDYDDGAKKARAALERAGVEAAFEIRRRLRKLAVHHLEEDEAVAAALEKVDLLLSPTKVGPDLLKLCKALGPHRALISQDPTWWREGDLERGAKLAKQLIDGQARDSNGLTVDETLGRLWALLLELYTDVRDGLWYITRKDETPPELPGFWKKVRQIQATKRPKASAAAEEAPTDGTSDASTPTAEDTTGTDG